MLSSVFSLSAGFLRVSFRPSRIRCVCLRLQSYNYNSCKSSFTWFSRPVSINPTHQYDISPKLLNFPLPRPYCLLLLPLLSLSKTCKHDQYPLSEIIFNTLPLSNLSLIKILSLHQLQARKAVFWAFGPSWLKQPFHLLGLKLGMHLTWLVTCGLHLTVTLACISRSAATSH